MWLFDSAALLANAVGAAAIVHLFVIGYEEPTLRRPVVVSRKAPHFPGRGGHSPLRRPVARTISRCTCQKDTTNHRGGRRALPPAMLTPK